MQREFYKDILDNLFDGVYFVDQNRCITYWNLGAQRITGYSPQEVQGRRCADNLLRHISELGDQLCRSGCPLAQTLLDGVPREAEVFLHHKDGHRVPVVVRISPLRDESGAITGAVEVFSDSTSRLRLQCELKELTQQSLKDPLTGLNNRRSASREFERRLRELQRYNLPFGLLFVDIDHFKQVNDTYGHEVGDRVLVAVAKTLVSATRGVDCVCRWGGDEFLVLVPKVDEAAVHAVAERIRCFMEVSPIPLKDKQLEVSVCVGGVMARPDDTLETLPRRADQMMYKAKQSGRNCILLDCSPPDGSL